MSSQRSLGISKNTFWYLKMISASTHKWYCIWLCHIRGDKWSPAQSIFLLGLNFSHFGLFVPWSTRFLQRFFGYGSKLKNMSFCTGMYTIPTRKQAKSRKKWVITWIRSQLQWSQKQLILVITTTTPYLHPPLTCLLCACSDNNIIISYTTLIRRAEENRVSSTQQPTTSTSNKPLVDDLIYPPPWWCGLQ